MSRCRSCNSSCTPVSCRISTSNLINVVFSYIEESVGRYAAKAAVRICEALIADEEYDLTEDIQEMRELREADRLGPSTGSIVEEAEARGIPWIRLNKYSLCQLGYGANQKSCYQKALALGADIVVMLHPDYQYTPMLIPAMASIIAQNLYPVVLGSRILGKGALKGGMPMYKYIANRFLTLFQNILIGEKLSEYHTGYRAFSKEVIMALHLEANSDDFVFDNQMLSQIFMAGFEIGEVTCPTKYFEEASSINFKRSSIYGLGVLWYSVRYRLAKWGWKWDLMN